MVFKSIIGAVMLLLLPMQSFAITLNGVDLLSYSGASFPIATPSMNGTSIEFSNGDQRLEKLMVINLFSPGELIGSTPTSFSVSLNMTRLVCVSAPPDYDCPNNPDDWDPHILLTDGTNMIGTVVADNNNGEGIFAELDDLGDIGANRELTSMFTNAGYPDIGDSMDVNIIFTLGDSSTGVEVSFLSGRGLFTSSTTLDYSSAISLVLLRDNDFGEEYQLNTVTLPSAVPIPSVVWLFGSGLIGLIGLSRRKTNA